MNDILLKGPDVLNPIRAVLLRFRGGVHAALGDIRKMYNSIWLKEREMHLHRFLWRDSPGERLSESQHWGQTSWMHCTVSYAVDSKTAHLRSPGG